MSRYVDKIFKQKLSNHTVPVADDLWDKIEAKLPQKKKHKPKSFFITLALIPLMSLVLGYFVWNTISGSFTEQPAQQQSISIKAANIASETLSSDSNMLSSSVMNQSSNSLSNQINIVESNNSLTSTPVSSFLLQSRSGFKAKSPSLLGITTKLKNTLSQFGSIDIATNSFGPDNENRLSSIDNNTNEVNDEMQGSNQQISTASITRSPIHTTILDRLPAKESLVSSRLEGKFKEGIGLASAMKRKLQKTEPSKACPFGIENQQKSVDVYFSSDFNNRKLEVFDSKDQKLADLRNRSEFSTYSYSAGVRFGYNVSYRWNIHTGLNFSQIKENFKYENPESSQTRLITIKDYIYQNGKIVDSVVTQQVVNVPGTMQYDVENTYRTIDVPIVARYVVMANNMMSISGTIGTMINISMSQRGMILNERLNVADDISSGTVKGNQTFRNQLGLSPVFGLSLALHLTDKIDFLLEPNYKFQSQSITKGDYPLGQKYATYSISTGLRFNF